MNPAQVIGGLLSGVASYLQAKRVQHQINDAFDMIEAVNNWLARVITAITDTDSQEQGAVIFSAKYAKQVGSDLEQVQGTQQRYWNRLFDVILPASLKHAYGVTQQWAIAYFSPPITDLYNHVDDLIKSRLADEQYLYGYLVPGVRDLLQFRADFFKGDQPALDVLNDWLSHPGDFGKFAAAPVIGPVVSYLAQPEHEQTRDNLARIMVDAWSEVPNDVWESILRWSVTEH